MNLFPWRTARAEKDAEVEDAMQRQREATQKLANALIAARGTELRELMNSLIPTKRKPARDNRQ